ncbi:MAG: 50S ribosomal protein L6 [Candidatus Omnitrophica bacterium]|nr:50S ribosomal protein L6 [Candidatus Omnitrophota bacterium]
MSRIGKKPIDIPSGIKVTVNANKVIVEGPKGKLEHAFPAHSVKVRTEGTRAIVERSLSDEKGSALQGLTRTLIANLIKGVRDGYEKQLEIKGVGYKAQAQGNVLQITLGFSHPIKYELPMGISVATPKPTQIVLKGIDKVKIGEVAAHIRNYLRPEPYTGKGIMYTGERVRRKAGKTVVK